MPRMFVVAMLGVFALTGGTSAGSDVSTPLAVELTDAGNPRSGLAPVMDSTGTDALAIEPLRQIAGSERLLVGDVGLDLPAGWTAEHVNLEGGSAVRLFDGKNPVGAVSYTGEGPADAYAVQRALDGASDSWGDLAVGLRRLPVVWSGMPDAGALVFSFADPSAGGAEVDVLVVAAHATGPSGVVVALLMAPAGTLDASPAYEVLRTIRFEGDAGGSTVGAGIYQSSYAIGSATGALVLLTSVIWFVVWVVRRAKRKPAPSGAAMPAPVPLPDSPPGPPTASRPVAW